MTDNLSYLFISIVISFLITLSLIIINRKLGNKFIDNFDGVQKFHSSPTPRIGGVSIFISFFISIYLIGNNYKTFQFLIFVSVLPAFLIGVIEDIKRNINPNYRLLATFLSGFLFIMLTGYHIKELDIYLIDNILSIYGFSLILTCFAISGVINAINIIDGFHGLASGSLIIMFASFAMIGWYTEDYLINNLAIISILIYAGFFILNFPFGFIFLGDSGAYFGGFLLSVLAIMLPYRNPEISSWVSLLICSYPITETIFSIYRKIKRKGHHPSRPDGLHLHMLVYRSVSRKIANKTKLQKYRNAITSLILWIFPVGSCLISLFLYENEIYIMISVLFFIFLYLLIYRKVSLNL